MSSPVNVEKSIFDGKLWIFIVIIMATIILLAMAKSLFEPEFDEIEEAGDAAVLPMAKPGEKPAAAVETPPAAKAETPPAEGDGDGDDS